MSEKTPEELAEELAETIRKAGGDQGSWGKMGGGYTTPPFLTQQVELAKKLRAALQQHEAVLSSELQKAKETLHQIKHGGGT